MSAPKSVSERKRAANRANSLKSTGPRTRRGKRRSAMNGFVHGFFAQHLVLKGEDPREFAQLRRTILGDLRPRNTIELALCERVVSASWRLRRLQTIESVTHHTTAGIHLAQSDDSELLSDDDSIDASQRRRSRRRFVARAMRMPSISTIARGLAMGDDLMERLSRYESRLEMSIHRSLRQLEKVRKQSQKATESEPAEPAARPEVADVARRVGDEKVNQIVRSEATAKNGADASFAYNPPRETPRDNESEPHEQIS